MIIGLTLICVVVGCLITFRFERIWIMFSSWWRKIEPSVGLNTIEILNNGRTSTDIDDVLSDAESTPKASPLRSGSVILAPNQEDVEDEPAIICESDDNDTEDDMLPTQFPALNSAQRASQKSMVASHAVNEVVATKQSGVSSPSSLMPPPNRLAASSSQLPRLSATIINRSEPSRAPRTGILPDRGPGNNLTSLRVPVTTVPPPSNSRKKIILSPGHSPLDWANLQRTHPNLSNVASFQRVTPSMLKANNGRKGRQAWSSYQGKVYNLTPYLPFHPGGEGELRRAAGKDGEKLFTESHPWVNWNNMLNQCLVGIMVSENDTRAGMGSVLDEMD